MDNLSDEDLDLFIGRGNNLSDEDEDCEEELSDDVDDDFGRFLWDQGEGQ